MENASVSAYEQEIQFYTGFAGSGKSTLLAEKCNDMTLVLTPTHMAAGVLVAKGIKNVFTIHSVLKLVPTINQDFRKGQKLESLKRIGDLDLSTIKEVAIDEFSMINVSIMDLLLSVLPEHCKVLVFGDPYQLPPVDGEVIEPLAYTDNIFELTTQHRAEAPEVVETFMRFMKYIRGDGEMNLKLNSKIQEGSLANFNPATDRALAYTNVEVIRLNNEINTYLGGTEELVEEDNMLINGMDAEFLSYSDDVYVDNRIFPSCMSKGKLMEDDKLQLAMLKTSNDIDKFNTNISDFKSALIVIDNWDYTIYYDLHHYETSKKLKREVEIFQQYVITANNLSSDSSIKEFCANNRSAKGVKDRGIAWSRYLAHKNLVFDMRRPYATTVHKSQGKEFNTVYIAQGDMKKAIRNGYYMQYARLMYVALSRAVNKVVII